MTNITSENNLPPEKKEYHWTESVLKPSEFVLIRVVGVKNVLIGRYHHGESQWYSEMFNGQVDVIEWWPIPEIGTGTQTS